MKVTIDRSALDAGLGCVGAVVPGRTPRAILQCVHLTARDGAVLLSATDGSLGIRYAVPQVEIADEGEVVLPSAKLSQIVSTSSDETLVFETAESSCHVRGRDSHFEVYSQDPAEFPAVAAMEGKPDLELPAGELRDLVEKTVYAAAKENTRYAINGALWEKKGNKLRLVATDGRRLAMATRSIEKGVGEDQRAIVPVRTLRVALRLLADPDQTAAVRISENQFQLRVGGAQLGSVLVEGNFPRYEDVVPSDCDIKVELGTDEFASAVRRAALLTTDDSKGIRLAFSAGELVLSSRTPEHGEATVKMPVSFPSEALQIGFNPTYLTDALAVVGTETVTLELKEPARPGLLKAGTDFLYVVMPVSLS